MRLLADLFWAPRQSKICLVSVRQRWLRSRTGLLEETHAPHARESTRFGTGCPPHTRADARLPAQTSAQAGFPPSQRRDHRSPTHAARSRSAARLAALLGGEKD